MPRASAVGSRRSGVPRVNRTRPAHDAPRGSIGSRRAPRRRSTRGHDAPGRSRRGRAMQPKCGQTAESSWATPVASRWTVTRAGPRQHDGVLGRRDVVRPARHDPIAELLRDVRVLRGERAERARTARRRPGRASSSSPRTAARLDARDDRRAPRRGLRRRPRDRRRDARSRRRARRRRRPSARAAGSTRRIGDDAVAPAAPASRRRYRHPITIALTRKAETRAGVEGGERGSRVRLDVGEAGGARRNVGTRAGVRCGRAGRAVWRMVASGGV